jgi:hypothetical protein
MAELHTDRGEPFICPLCQQPLRAIASIRSGGSWHVLLSCEECAFATRRESLSNPFTTRRIGRDGLEPLTERNGAQ